MIHGSDPRLDSARAPGYCRARGPGARGPARRLAAIVGAAGWTGGAGVRGCRHRPCCARSTPRVGSTRQPCSTALRQSTVVSLAVRRFLLKIAIHTVVFAGKRLCRARIAAPLVRGVEAKLFEIRWRRSRAPGPDGGALAHLFQRYEPGTPPAAIYREIFSRARYRAGYYSQFGQDLFLDRWFFKSRRGGVFVDVGAYDGVTGSNTYYFERHLGWRGVAFEANPDVVADLIRNRSCEIIDGCAYEHDGTVEFVALTEAPPKAAQRPLLEPLNAASIVFDGRHAGTMLSGIESHLQERSRMSRSEREHRLQRSTKSVKCFRIDTVLRRLEIRVVDFLDIDVEGAEYEVLRGVDFEAVHVNVISVEWNPRFPEVHALLTDAGFEYQGLLMYDEIFVNTALRFSWEGDRKAARGPEDTRPMDQHRR